MLQKRELFLYGHVFHIEENGAKNIQHIKIYSWIYAIFRIIYFLATEVIGAGCCAIGGYYQDKIDKLIEIDGEDEFAVLYATIGKIKTIGYDVYANIHDIRDKK